MRYFIDTEFTKFNGEIISIALVREDGESRYFVLDEYSEPDQWVKDNVIPILWDIPSPLPGMAYRCKDKSEIARHLYNFLSLDSGSVRIILDWPDDIKYFMECLLTGPGMMINLDNIHTQMVRVDAYPTDLPGAVQHNAWWDAMALRWEWQKRGWM